MTAPRPGARSRLRLLVLPLLLLLAGCVRMELGFTIQPDDTADLAMEVVDKTGMMTRDDLDCTALAAEVGQAGLPAGVDYSVEDLDEDGNLGCALDVVGAPLSQLAAEGLSITRSGELYTFTLDGDGAGAAEGVTDLPGLEFTLAVTFPGEVVDDGGGDVTGNTVTWTDPAVLSSGVTATGRAAGPGVVAGEAGSDGVAGALPTGSLSWLWWALAGVGALAAIGGIVFLTRRTRTPADAAPAGGVADVFAPQGQQVPGGASGGYPPGAYGSPTPYQPSQPSDPYQPDQHRPDPYRPGHRTDPPAG
ncbi:hypothetical protein FE374_17190 [Georgenia yuyongxinii]|uniref:LppM domain-containing protein n=1 Tax=Georgenia yuyongxinii TaxID=2589797 RepID=A0A5B8C6D4_9MICO|nr:hypothetical protein [Georgenia yuyongxinii]QDC26113.1 hypothetical protein FE374_17190 [Georgenia yuyongxinii]